MTDSLQRESGQVRMSGFFPNNEAFVEAVNVALATATGGWDLGRRPQLYAESLGSTGWRLVPLRLLDAVLGGGCTGAASTTAPAGLLLARGTSSPAARARSGSTRSRARRSSRSRSGRATRSTSPAPVPRAVLGEPAGSAWWPFTDTLRPQYGSDRLYLGGTAVPSTLQMLGVETGIGRGPALPGGERCRRLRALGADRDGPPLMLLGPNSRIHIMRYPPS